MSTFIERYAQRRPVAVRRIGDAAILAVITAPALTVLATRSDDTVVAVLGALASPVFYATGYLAAQPRHRHQLREVRAALAEARRDPLTGLSTRAVADRLLQMATRGGTNLTVALADLDGLHAVNSNLGHAAGDQYLLAVAARLARAVPAGGCLVRQGGDEFTLLAPDTDPEDLAAAISGALSEPAVIAGYRIQPRASVGIATSGGGDAAYTRACADAAMYTAKAAGGNHTLVYHPDRDGRPESDGTRSLIRRRDLNPISPDGLAWAPAPGDDLLPFLWSVEEARTVLQALHTARDRWARAGAEAHAGAQRPDVPRSSTPDRINVEPTRGGYHAIAEIAADEQAKYARLADRMRAILDAAEIPGGTGQAPRRSHARASDAPVGVSAAFTPTEIEGLVRTAAEALHGDPDDLSTRQRDLAARAYTLMQAELDG